MIEVIVVSHGSYAQALVESSELIMGEQEGVYSFGFTLGENVDELRERIENKINEIKAEKPEAEILILTDMKSGSPFNATARLMQQYDFTHVAGVNLPIFLEIMGTRDFQTMAELKHMIFTTGLKTIVDVNKMMEEMG